MPEEAAVRLRNTNPLGEIDLPLIGRSLAAGEEFEVDDDTGLALLEQVGNYEPADPDDLAALTVPELVEYAEKHSVDLDGATKKAEVLAAIKKGTAK